MGREGGEEGNRKRGREGKGLEGVRGIEKGDEPFDGDNVTPVMLCVAFVLGKDELLIEVSLLPNNTS